ncbi:type VI secretion system protein TssA [Candidatus Venteria ishoeyi]|uniref:ImpA N-terminal domain-containing protein n=1 Tax=Candidatus Venteria ishoeyi TaxID=1899563 RepID=A0A1H6FI39_9GAMM|nr:type VI secretion system protein TssA [Candidatus Venteria ishoeyi]MDM8547689.1 type VI secretion system protein TssA [Candidatus Venteria ishoeyi]SEH09039.1 Uncharacterised protein [Candidatus Venteria ishoeyi]
MSDAPESWIEQYWQNLLTPISPQAPAGESLMYDPVYDAIKEARREEPDLPQGDWQYELKKADWSEVARLCIDVLSNRSKDLQIAVWLSEALLHKQGFHGVQDGLKLLDALCQTFWDSLWPALESDDLELRLSPLIWLNEKLSLKLSMVDITQPQDNSQQVFHSIDYQKALRNKEKSDDSLYLRIIQSSQSTPLAYYQALQESLEQSQQTLNQLEQWLDSHCGRDAPSFSKFREKLQETARIIHFMMKDRLPETPVTTQEASASSTEAQEHSSMSTDASGAIQNRAQAYQLLNEAADYLQRTEPHSPTPYLVKRAVSWGHLPLQELLHELVNDESDLRAIYSLLGMQNPDNNSQDY